MTGKQIMHVLGGLLGAPRVLDPHVALFCLVV